MLQLRLYLLLMLHLLILGQQQLGPRLGRRLVMLPPCARRVLLDGTCQHGALAKATYVRRAASAAGAARLLFVHDKVTRSVNVNLTRPVDNSLPGLIVTYGGARRTRRERLARESL